MANGLWHWSLRKLENPDYRVKDLFLLNLIFFFLIQNPNIWRLYGKYAYNLLNMQSGFFESICCTLHTQCILGVYIYSLDF